MYSFILIDINFVNCRISYRSAFMKLKPVISNHTLDIHLWECLPNCYVCSIFEYGCGTWTLKTVSMNRIEGLKIRIYRKILLTKRVRHEEYLRKMGHDRLLLDHEKRRILEYLRHFLRGSQYQLLSCVQWLNRG